MSSFLKSTKADVKEARKVLKQSKKAFTRRELLEKAKQKIWKTGEMKKRNPLPMKSTRAEQEEAKKKTPVCLF